MSVALRLIGDPDDVAAVLAALEGVVEVTERSAPYPSRRDAGQVRVYGQVQAVPAPGRRPRDDDQEG